MEGSALPAILSLHQQNTLLFWSHTQQYPEITSGSSLINYSGWYSGEAYIMSGKQGKHPTCWTIALVPQSPLYYILFTSLIML